MSRSAWFLLILFLAVVSGFSCGGGNSQMQPPPPPPPPPPDTFTTTTSQQGSLLIVQNQTSTDTIRIGLETAWGGSIVEVSFGGITTVSGWSLDDASVAKVEILVDGVVDGTASYGSSRPDVAGTYPGAPVNIGFSYLLNTAKYGNGTHTLNVRATDSSGNVSVFPDVGVTVGN